MNQLKKSWQIFTQNEKRGIGLLLLMTIIGSFLELLGVSAIMPFVNVTMDPKSIEDSSLLSSIYNMFGLKTTSSFLIVLAIALVFIYLSKNIFLIILYNFQYKFTYWSQQRLETKLLSCYLNQDYIFHLSHNSAELQRNIIQDVNGFYLSVLAYLQLLTEGFVCVTLFLYLLYIDKAITLVVTLFMVIFVVIFQSVFRKKMNTIGEKSRYYSAKRVQWVQQSLNGTKEIKILGRESFFIDSYHTNAIHYADKLKKYQVTMAIPRPLMETMCICSLLVVVAFKLSKGVDISYFIPTLSVFVVAAFRLLPSFSRISGYVGSISFQRSAVDRVCLDVEEAEELQKNYDQNEKGNGEIEFKEKIEVRNLNFHYPNVEKNVLSNVNLIIPKNKSVAFIGPSGAGKTTLADIILGVLTPQVGEVCIDNQNIHMNMEAWHQKLGYIPQNIYLMDDTIRNNVAFGIPKQEIDDAMIKSALKEAQLLEYVEGLENGIHTFIGEGGVRISGGQRQRIGIARALYMNPEVLILDEATSALDNDTEKAIMEAIHILQGSKTLIIIAHRLTTIQNCDYIYEIKEGKATLKEKEEVL